jgi:hypothetical protein
MVDPATRRVRRYPLHEGESHVPPEELRRLVRDTHPFPIAHAYKKTLGLIEDDAHKLKCLMESAETTVQFLALTALAQLRQDLGQNQAPATADLAP